MTDLEARPTSAKSSNASDAVAHYIAQAVPVSDSTMLGIFDVLRDGWFDKKSSGDAPDLTVHVTAVALELELERPQEFADAFQVLVRGAAATPHDNRVQALYHARNLARLLISSHRIGSTFDEYDLPDVVGYQTLPARATTSERATTPTTSKVRVESEPGDYDIEFELAV